MGAHAKDWLGSTECTERTEGTEFAPGCPGKSSPLLPVFHRWFPFPSVFPGRAEVNGAHANALLGNWEYWEYWDYWDYWELWVFFVPGCPGKAYRTYKTYKTYKTYPAEPWGWAHSQRIGWGGTECTERTECTEFAPGCSGKSSLLLPVFYR